LLTGHAERALGGVLLILLVFACVVLHELGHALTARRYGIRTRDIVLLPIGGVARLERMPDKPSQEIVVALAGPAVNLAIAAVLWIALGRHVAPDVAQPVAGDIIESLLTINLMMLLFNLIPAFPMDGGRVLRAVLALKLPYVRATRIASLVGQGIALLFGVAGLFILHNPMLVFVALFVFLAAGEEHAIVRARATLSGLPARAAMVSEFDVLDVSDPLRHAVARLMAGSQQDFPVLEGDVPIGLLTRAELLMGLQRSGPETPVGDVVARDQLTAEAGEPLEEALRRMREHRRPALPVVSGGRLVGMLTLENVSELMLVQKAMARRA
ncbi:MAG: site-2 protease family protein, partial [Candidatus Eisenbacteria bacterium]|nr:site-2 protease family protein [Candidatus Eisenbacteria bacterium]